jgi:hypothetical protein
MLAQDFASTSYLEQGFAVAVENEKDEGCLKQDYQGMQLMANCDHLLIIE